jgi:hypothetical protein
MIPDAAILRDASAGNREAARRKLTIQGPALGFAK